MALSRAMRACARAAAAARGPTSSIRARLRAAAGASIEIAGQVYGRPSESFSGKAPWHTVNAPGMQQTDPRAIGVPGAKPGHAASAASREDDCPQDEEACPGKS